MSHLFVVCISDGTYDARERALIIRLADELEIPWHDVNILETTVAEQLRVNEELGTLKKDDNILVERNKKDQTKRWVAMGLAALAGGTVIGLTAGLAAPLIGAGMTTALGAIGVTGIDIYTLSNHDIRCRGHAYWCHWKCSYRDWRCACRRRCVGKINVEAYKRPYRV